MCRMFRSRRPICIQKAGRHEEITLGPKFNTKTYILTYCFCSEQATPETENDIFVFEASRDFCATDNCQP